MGRDWKVCNRSVINNTQVRDNYNMRSKFDRGDILAGVLTELREIIG
jgi:hypothetical protein